jgi:hypothetical protein
MTLCKDWPLENLGNATYIDDKVCTNVKAARVLLIMSVVFHAIGTIGGLVRVFNKEMFPVPTAAVVVLGGICGCSGWAVWQGGVQKALGHQLAQAVDAQLSVTVTGGGTSKLYHTTLGESYGIVLWGWLWPLASILSKVFLPNLEISKEDQEEIRRKSRESNMRASGGGRGSTSSNIATTAI